MDAIDSIDNDLIENTARSSDTQLENNYVKIESHDAESKQPVRSSTRRRKRSRLTLTSRKSNKLYSCKECCTNFSRKSLLKAHQISHVDGENKKYQCDECKKYFSSWAKLIRHRQAIHAYVLKCEICGNEFSHIMSYKVHMRVHSGDLPYLCNECDAKFSQSSHLSIHKRSHTGEKPYRCDICEQCFKQISHLRAHERIHTQCKPYECDSCKASFIQKSSLKRHSRIHTGERPYVCMLCNASFCVKNNLNRHVQAHSGRHSFECYCGATFNEGFDLKRHEMAHDGLKPFSCTKCDASFSRKSNLARHMLIHTGETPFKCEKCPSAFMNPRDLRKHGVTHGSIIVHNCSTCKEKFNNKHNLKQHVSSTHVEHKTVCDICSKTFSAPSCLKRHRLIHFRNCSQCKVCKTKFKDDLLLLAHSKSCGKENIATTAVIVESKCTNEVEIIQPEISEPISYVQVQGVSSHDVQGTIPSGVTNTNGSLPHNVFCDPNGYLTVTNQGPAIIWGLQNESMVVARPSLNCPNTTSHIYIVGNNNQMESWCFCGSTSAITEGQCLTTVESPTAPRPIECVQVHTKYLSGQTYQTDLDVRYVGNQPLVLGPLNISAMNTDVHTQFLA